MPTSTAAERQAFIALIRVELDRLADEVFDKEHSSGLNTAVETELEMDLRRAEVLAARAATLASDDWDETADQLEQAVIRLRLALTARAADQRATTADDVEAARRAVLDQFMSWQAFLEELVVQAHLAGMDTRDTLDTLAGRGRELRRFLRHTARHPVAGTTEALADLRNEAVRAWSSATASSAESRPRIPHS